MTLYGSPLATICAVNGVSPAAGLLLSLACDARVAIENHPESGKPFRTGLNEAAFGLVAPDFFLPPLIATAGER